VSHGALIAKPSTPANGQTDEEALAREPPGTQAPAQGRRTKGDRARDAPAGGGGLLTGVIYKILRQWDVPDEALAALDNAGQPGGRPARGLAPRGVFSWSTAARVRAGFWVSGDNRQRCTLRGSSGSFDRRFATADAE